MKHYYLVIYQTAKGTEKHKVHAKMSDILNHFISNKDEVLIKITKISKKQFLLH